MPVLSTAIEAMNFGESHIKAYYSSFKWNDISDSYYLNWK